MSHTIDEALAAVTAESTQVDSVLTLLNQLRAQVADALSKVGSLTPEQQAAIDTVFDTATAASDRITTAINATPTV